MSSDAVIGMHDLVVHDYGPGRMMISLHAEVDGRGDIFQLHDSIDTVERKLKARSAATRRFTWTPSRPTTSR